MIGADTTLSFPQRKDLMSLDVVRSKDIPRGKVQVAKDFCLSLMTEDIFKAQPFYRASKFTNKIDYMLISDVPGSKSKSHYPEVNRIKDLSLTTEDIEWAQPKVVHSKSKRCTDPVQPQYQLPSYKIRPITPLKGNGRITNQIDGMTLNYVHYWSDIDYTWSKKLIPDRNYERSTTDVADIEFAAPNYRRRVLRPIKKEGLTNSLNVKDINHDPECHQPQPRNSNPLDPLYVVSQAPLTSLNARWSEERREPPKPLPAIIGEVPFSKPRKLTWDNGEPTLKLMTEDIAGATSQRFVGSVPFNLYDPPSVRPIITFHHTYDVPGAQVGSLRKAPVTNRRTNPLDPEYDWDRRGRSMPASSRSHESRGVSRASQKQCVTAAQKLDKFIAA